MGLVIHRHLDFQPRAAGLGRTPAYARRHPQNEGRYCHPQDTCKEQAAGLLDTMLQPADAVAWEQERKMLEEGNQ